MKAFLEISHGSLSIVLRLPYHFPLSVGMLPDRNICLSDSLWKYWIRLSQTAKFHLCGSKTKSHTVILSFLIFLLVYASTVVFHFSVNIKSFTRNLFSSVTQTSICELLRLKPVLAVDHQDLLAACWLSVEPECVYTCLYWISLCE